MTALQTTFAITTKDATQWNTNYSDIVTYINNRNSGTATWDAMSISHATNIPLTANNSTGAQDIAQFLDNGAFVGEVFDGGIINWPYQDYAFCSGGAFVASTGTTVKWAPVSTTVQSQTHSNLDSTPKFTCASVGKYLVTFMSKNSASGVDNFDVLLYKNGASISKATGRIGVTNPQTNRFLDIVSLSVADYLEIYVTGGASNSNSFSSAGSNFWTISKLA